MSDRRWPLLEPPDYYVQHLCRLQRAIRGHVSAALAEEASAQLAGTTGARGGDTIYQLDQRAESPLLAYCEAWGQEAPFVLVAEGLSEDGQRVFPQDATAESAAFWCLMDPIDGTRGLMHGKRSAWSLAAIAPAPAQGQGTPTLSEVYVAVQTELPTPRARLADTLWAVRGQGAAGETEDLVTGTTVSLRLRPSAATSLAHGFATISKFFPGTKAAAVWIEERLLAEVVGDDAGGNPLVFDDEYICTGGQLYELMTGHDRFVADLRPELQIAAGGPISWLCVHPYDICTELIAREVGVHVTDAWGQPLAAPFDVHTPVSWAGYANAVLQNQIEPVLQRLLREYAALRQR